MDQPCLSNFFNIANGFACFLAEESSVFLYIIEKNFQDFVDLRKIFTRKCSK